MDTSAPSVKWTLSTTPPTRGRNSTYSAASSRPLKVSLSETVRATAGATLTGGAWGGPPCASAGPPQALSHDMATRRRDHNARGMPRRGARDELFMFNCLKRVHDRSRLRKAQR
ncbi:hypothetical protein [Hydrogenophaga sp.]|uniref:hypothetical protein n=1 Tax=Hydrogenophaga sp. TaxID=1904254 RepID=UPI002AC94312|nr:hypothetical protein [Hydrogenophaga sp.]